METNTGFKKHILANLPWLVSLIFLIFYFLIGNSELGSWKLYKTLQIFFLLPNLVLVLIQLILWKKLELPFKTNLAGWTAIFITSFYYALDANILFFLKTATIYYTTFIFYKLVAPLLVVAQIGIWLLLLFRRLRLR